MALGNDLIKKLQQRYEPTAMVDMRHKGLDISFKTDEVGHPILLFIGKRNAAGVVQGKRYVRTLLFDATGQKIKDHWELKGKAS